MAGYSVKSVKSGPKSVPAVPQHGQFVLGSRPSGVRAPSVPRIKPALSQRQYGKSEEASFGDTGETSRS